MAYTQIFQCFTVEDQEDNPRTPDLKYVVNWSSTIKSSPWIWKGVSATLQSGRYTKCVYSLEVVDRRRDPQLHVSENCPDVAKWRSTIYEILLIDVTFYFNVSKSQYTYPRTSIHIQKLYYLRC